MKTVVSKIIAIWVGVLLVGFILMDRAANSEQQRYVQQQANWLQQQQAKVAQKLDGFQVANVTERRHLISELSLLPSVHSVSVLSATETLETYTKSIDADVLYKYQIPLFENGQRFATLEVQFDLNGFTGAQGSGFSWHWTVTLLLLSAGVALHYWVLQPMFHLEQKAEAILSGDFEPSHFASSDEHPLTSELAINLLLNEYQSTKQEHTDLSNRLRKHSFVDPVTGLGNREYFDAELEVHLKGQDQSVNGAVVMFSFEPILELQHESKEQFESLLKQVGHYFQRFIDEEDLCWVARRGSVDFSLLILEEAPDKVRRMCNKVIKDLSRSVFDATEFSHHFVSIGATFFQTGDDAYEVLASADMSLRNAQLEGDNKIHMYQPKKLSKDQIKGSVRWRTFLQSVLEKRQVILLFQPQVTVEDASYAQFEVLSRIEEKGKMIAASVFLPMANRCGLAADFDRLIVDKSLKELSFGSDFSDTGLSINLFSDSVLNTRFVTWLKQRLSMTKGINHRITFEISEYAASRSIEQMRDTMTQIAELGCHWCVEHVGSPTADLSYLSELPISRLKIGQTTVRGLVEQSEKQLFVQTLITAAHQAGVSVWAEGVETEAEWNVLLGLGIEGGQGYYFGTPQDKLFVSAEEPIASDA